MLIRHAEYRAVQRALYIDIGGLLFKLFSGSGVGIVLHGGTEFHGRPPFLTESSSVLKQHCKEMKCQFAQKQRICFMDSGYMIHYKMVQCQEICG